MALQAIWTYYYKQKKKMYVEIVNFFMSWSILKNI